MLLDKQGIKLKKIIEKYPYCQGSKIVKRDKREKKFEEVQVYYCQNCSKRFTPNITNNKTGKSTKNFDEWNEKKKETENRNIDNPKVMFCDRAIWWCSVGVNIGIEQDGKGKNFERPVLILRKFNKHIFLGIPLTTKKKNLNLPFYFKLNGAKVESIAILSQIRLFSSKRLLREIEIIKPELFNQLKKQLKIATSL